MQDNVFYRIISNPKQKPQSSTSHDFHRSIPIKMQPISQDSSVVYLSSLIQTENLLQNKLASTSINFTTRQFQHSKEGQQGRGMSEKVVRYPNNQRKEDAFLQTKKRRFKNENALINLVGEVDPSGAKKDNKFIEERIYKARTYTIMPMNKIDAMPTFKKRQNQVKLKEDFRAFLNNKDSNPSYNKQSEPDTQYINNRLKTQAKSTNPADLYHFQTKQVKRMKTVGPTDKHYPTLSKRMTEMLLKNQLKGQIEHFNFIQYGRRKSFKLKTTQ